MTMLSMANGHVWRRCFDCGVLTEHHVGSDGSFLCNTVTCEVGIIEGERAVSLRPRPNEVRLPGCGHIEPEDGD